MTCDKVASKNRVCKLFSVKKEDFVKKERKGDWRVAVGQIRTVGQVGHDGWYAKCKLTTIKPAVEPRGGNPENRYKKPPSGGIIRRDSGCYAPVGRTVRRLAQNSSPVRSVTNTQRHQQDVSGSFSRCRRRP